MSPPPPNEATASAPPCAPAPDAHKWFAEEVHPHDRQLKSWLRGQFPGVHDVDDVVQESYLRIWKARAAQPIASAKAFLFKVARHLALDLVRRNRRSPINPVSDLASLGVLEDKPAADQAVLLQEKIDLLSDAIAALPDRRREVVILCKLKRLTAREAAEQLGIAPRTVENLLLRGVRDCENYLRAHGLNSFSGDERR